MSNPTTRDESRPPPDQRRGAGIATPLLGARLLLLLAVVASALAAVTGRAQEVPELRITSNRYIVIDAETGEVFAQRGADDPVAMASLTKIFTAIETIEHAPPDLPITTTEDDLVPVDATQMGFAPGETFTIEDLLYGMMLPSGNDAARAIARSLGGQPGDTADQAIARFLARANERVRDMGLANTSLVNPDGWGVPGHHSSARDLAVFTMYALRYPRFVEAIGAERYQTSAGGYTLTNSNKLLGSYNGLVGGKTGFDEDAGYCLVEVATRDGRTMISVTLDGVAPDDWYDDNRVLLDYAFAQRAGRAAAGLGVTGEVVGYRDPDAAAIARVANPGASIGLGAPVPEATVTGGIGQVAEPARGGSGEPPGPLPSLAAGDRSAGFRPAIALAVVAALLALRFGFAFRHAPVRALTTVSPSSRQLRRWPSTTALRHPRPSPAAPVRPTTVPPVAHTLPERDPPPTGSTASSSD